MLCHEKKRDQKISCYSPFKRSNSDNCNTESSSTDLFTAVNSQLWQSSSCATSSLPPSPPSPFPLTSTFHPLNLLLSIIASNVVVILTTRTISYALATDSTATPPLTSSSSRPSLIPAMCHPTRNRDSCGKCFVNYVVQCIFLSLLFTGRNACLDAVWLLNEWKCMIKNEIKYWTISM